MPKFQTRKRFGQHFLRDALVLEEMVALIDARDSDHLLEIGPGQGALTEQLLAGCPSMRAMEIDRDLCEHLRRRMPSLELIEGDVLSSKFTDLLNTRRNWRLVGNLPYNISTPLLARVAKFAHKINDAWFLVQREVAERLIAEPGTRDWSRLSILVRLHYQVEVCFEIEPKCFHPPPKVTSSFVHLRSSARERGIISPPTFEEVVLQAFTQRRKTLHNALRKFSIDWSPLSVNPSKRPDQIGIDAYIEIANHLAGEALREGSNKS